MRWNSVAQKCEPDVCSGRNLLDVPGYDGFITKDILEDVPIYDTNKTRQCFKNKYIVLIGDSSVSELTHDFVILLNRLAIGDDAAFHRYLDCCVIHKNTKGCANIEDESTNATMELLYINNTVVIGGKKKKKRYLLEGNSKLELDAGYGHRNMTFSMPEFNIRIRYLFFIFIFLLQKFIFSFFLIDIGLMDIRIWGLTEVVSPAWWLLRLLVSSNVFWATRLCGQQCNQASIAGSRI